MGAIVSAADVKSWGDLTTVENDIVDVVITAAEAALDRLYVVPVTTDDPPVPDVDADTKLALLMQCTRLLERRRSPLGVIPGFETGALRVSRFDPDIAELIGLRRKVACA